MKSVGFLLGDGIISQNVVVSAVAIAQGVTDMGQDAEAMGKFRAACSIGFNAFAAMMNQDASLPEGSTKFPPLCILMFADVMASYACASMAEQHGGNAEEHRKAWALQRAEHYGILPPGFGQTVLRAMAEAAQSDEPTKH